MVESHSSDISAVHFIFLVLFVIKLMKHNRRTIVYFNICSVPFIKFPLHSYLKVLVVANNTANE